MKQLKIKGRSIRLVDCFSKRPPRQKKAHPKPQTRHVLSNAHCRSHAVTADLQSSTLSRSCLTCKSCFHLCSRTFQRCRVWGEPYPRNGVLIRLVYLRSGCSKLLRGRYDQALFRALKEEAPWSSQIQCLKSSSSNWRLRHKAWCYLRISRRLYRFWSFWEYHIIPELANTIRDHLICKLWLRMSHREWYECHGHGAFT